MSRAPLLACLGLLVLTALVVSSIAPYDRTTWLMEVAPVLIATYRRFPLTTLLYTLIALHALVLILGGLRVGRGRAAAFLGTQGDPWDTQSDMFMALIGAVTALLTLARLQDRQLERLTASDAGGTPPAGG